MTDFHGVSSGVTTVSGTLPDPRPEGFHLLGMRVGAGGGAFQGGYYLLGDVPYTDPVTSLRHVAPAITSWGQGLHYVDGPGPSNYLPVPGRWEQHQAHLSGLLVEDHASPVEAECHIKVRIKTWLDSKVRKRLKTLQVFPASDLVLPRGGATWRRVMGPAAFPPPPRTSGWLLRWSSDQKTEQKLYTPQGLPGVDPVGHYAIPEDDPYHVSYNYSGVRPVLQDSLVLNLGADWTQRWSAESPTYCGYPFARNSSGFPYARDNGDAEIINHHFGHTHPKDPTAPVPEMVEHYHHGLWYPVESQSVPQWSYVHPLNMPDHILVASGASASENPFPPGDVTHSHEVEVRDPNGVSMLVVEHTHSPTDVMSVTSQLWPDQQTIWRLDASYESR